MSPAAAPTGGIQLSWRKVVAVTLSAAAAGGLASYLSQRPTGVALLRGNTTAVPQVTTPSNETLPAAAIVFEWKAPTDTARLVVVDVAQPQQPIIDREVAGERYGPTAEERKAFVTGHSYHWYVEAKGPEGRGRTSSAARFAIR